MGIYEKRVQKLQQKLQEQQIQAAIFFPSPNLYYMTGFHTFPEGRLLLFVVPSEGSTFFIAPKLYETQIRKEAVFNDLFLWKDEEDPYHLLGEVFAERKLGNGPLSIDDTMWAEQLIQITKMFPHMSLLPVGEMLRADKQIKTSEEIAYIREASRIVDEVAAVVQKTVRVGMTEIEIAALMEYEMRKRGAAGPSFETIVGAGANGALPHYGAGSKVLQTGEFIVFDFGAIYKGYCSDTTRTLCLGDPSSKMREVYEIVKEAQEIGVNTVKPGIQAKEVDRAVRKYVESKGYGEYFTHRTGHGLGMQVHEEPYISAVSHTILEPGMVFSIEPGIYLDGEFGVRIEDIVVVTETGCERLNHFPRELTIIGE